jgi:hypothetical protein
MEVVMPTGYTSYILDGISFNEFVLKCARNFGALIEMRDMSMDAKIPKEFKPHPYNLEEMTKAKRRLEKFKKLTPEQWEREAEKEYEREMREEQNSLKRLSERRKKYENMLAKVKIWKPVHSDLDNLKKFMMEQIKESIEFDCYTPDKPERLTGKEWAEEKRESLEHDIEHHAKEWGDEQKRAKDRTLWVERLRQSLK